MTENKKPSLFNRVFGSRQSLKEIKNQNEPDMNLIIPNVTSTKTELLGDNIKSMDDQAKIDLYDLMDTDAVISAALDLFADSATQMNQKTGHVASVKSTDADVEAELNEFLWNIIKVDTEAWQWVRGIAKNGKIFLDTTAENGGKEWSFIEVLNPARIHALTYGQDEIRAFAVSPELTDSEKGIATFIPMSQKSLDIKYEVQPQDRYIAGFNTRMHIGKMQVSTTSQLTGNVLTEDLYIRTGKSILENVVSTWQTLSALEDSVFLRRLTKSTTFNIVQIDVSDSNNKQAQEMIERVKTSFRSSETIDQTKSRFNNRQAPIPVQDYIYVPVRGTKGAVTVSQVGGELGQVDMTDVDYYRNKLFAGLGVLKAYLGFEETLSGGLGEGTLTRLDERFGKRAQRLQLVLKGIIKQIVEFYWTHSDVSRTLANMPKLSIELGKISTKEEEDRRAALTSNLDIADRLLSLADDARFDSYVNPEKLFKYVFEDVLGIDLKNIDNSVDEADINVTMHKVGSLHEKTKKIASRRLREHDHNHGNETDLDAILEEYDVFLENERGFTISLREAINRTPFRRALSEKTYKQLKNMTRERDPERIKRSKKITAKYTGIDDDRYITFILTAEDQDKNRKEGKPLTYDGKVSLNALTKLLKAKQEGSTDLNLVQDAIQGNIKVSCTCPAAKYWGQQYNGTKQHYSLDKNTIAPEKNLPTQVICKHTTLMLTVMPFYAQTIVRDLRAKGLLKSSDTQDKKVIQNAEKDKIKALAGDTEVPDDELEKISALAGEAPVKDTVEKEPEE